MNNESVGKLISVIMTAYNSERFIGDAIESVLNQSYQQFELLIIEDGSTDKTSSIIHSYSDKRIRLLSNEKNMGTLYSMRRGVSEARGDYIAVLDSDDIAEPDRFRKQLKLLDRKSEVLLCVTKAKNLINGRLEKRRYLPVYNSRQLLFSLLFGNDMIVHSAVMFRKRELLEKKIQYETYSYCHDYHLIMDVAQISPIYIINDELVQHRIHKQQKTSVLSKYKISKEVKEAKEEFIWQIKYLEKKEKKILCKADEGKLKTFWEYVRLKSAVLHYAVLCGLCLKNDRDFIYYELYRMFDKQRHSFQWYIYYMIIFYFHNERARKNK